MSLTKPTLLTLTPELVAAIDHARGGESRAAFVESLLRSAKPVRQAQRELGIQWSERPQMGPPRKYKPREAL
jgi:hypothetical protein